MLAVAALDGRRRRRDLGRPGPIRRARWSWMGVISCCRDCRRWVPDSSQLFGVELQGGVLQWRAGEDASLACASSTACDADSLSLTDFAPILPHPDCRSPGVSMIWWGVSFSLKPIAELCCMDTCLAFFDAAEPIRPTHIVVMLIARCMRWTASLV